jgi:hypothetical protein
MSAYDFPRSRHLNKSGLFPDVLDNIAGHAGVTLTVSSVGGDARVVLPRLRQIHRRVPREEIERPAARTHAWSCAPASVLAILGSATHRLRRGFSAGSRSVFSSSLRKLFSGPSTVLGWGLNPDRKLRFSMYEPDLRVYLCKRGPVWRIWPTRYLVVAALSIR